MAQLDKKKLLPEFLNTQEKWDQIVEETNTWGKFDKLALDIIDYPGMDVFHFGDILNHLRVDILGKYPETGNVITDISNTVNTITNAIKGMGDHSNTLKNHPYESQSYWKDESRDVVGNDGGGPSKSSDGQRSYPTAPLFRNFQEDRKFFPKYPLYSNLRYRWKSFVNYPKQLRPGPTQLAGAGFFYEGMGDLTTCFHCGLVLHNWEAEDNPKVEHKKFQPDCPFIQSVA